MFGSKDVRLAALTSPRKVMSRSGNKALNIHLRAKENKILMQHLLSSKMLCQWGRLGNQVT